MLGLKIFVRVQTFRRRPFIPSHNFCHPVNKIASEMEVASLQKLLTLLKKRGSVPRRFWYPGLASVFWLKNILINFAATSENEIEIKTRNIILKTFFRKIKTAKTLNSKGWRVNCHKSVTMRFFTWCLTLVSTFGGIDDFHGCRRYKGAKHDNTFKVLGHNIKHCCFGCSWGFEDLHWKKEFNTFFRF